MRPLPCEGMLTDEAVAAGDKNERSWRNGWRFSTEIGSYVGMFSSYVCMDCGFEFRGLGGGHKRLMSEAEPQPLLTASVILYEE